MTHYPGLLRIAPLQEETTSSLICRIASRYGLKAKALQRPGLAPVGDE
ncbi:hypothetical protein ABT272_29975 [Streptomyces sp900105245]|uniref:Uncharacterized protein n=1 Tax=Streptomyces sp. 900105245 TaxID=3154379 RepID=A0ABV1UE03_9ACTN